MNTGIILVDSSEYQQDIATSVRNRDGYWINTNVFREEALHFKKYGYYTPDVKNSPAWIEYWEEQLRRTLEGHTVGGAHITGDHYFYLNFSQITKVKKGEDPNSKKAKKITDFPDFWDGDYNYFHSINIAREGISLEDFKALNLEYKIEPQFLTGARHMIVGKSRRKGYSFKNSAICTNLYNNTRNSLSLICASDKKYLYPKGTMAMVLNNMDFINANTGWAKKRDFSDKMDYKKASYVLEVDGFSSEQGYKSSVMALSFNDDPEAAKGKDAQVVLFEEAGVFPNLAEAYSATEPSLRAGKYITGQILIFGTGGDMEGGSKDFAEMFYNPEKYNLLPFLNMWDDNAENTRCGFYHPISWNYDGFYDEVGNSDIEAATAYEVIERDKILKLSSDTGAYQRYIQEYSLKPAESFLTVSVNDFPVQEIRNRLNLLVRENLHLKKGQPVHLLRNNETGEVEIKQDLKGELEPIWHKAPKSYNRKGAVVIFEPPIMKKPPKGLYKIGYDPYRQVEGTSLAAIIVYKSFFSGNSSKDIIVAEYVGRAADPDDVNRTAEMLCELYNAELMFENEVTHVMSYFKRRKKLNLLALQPDTVISVNVKHSTVARVYGCHMTEKLKDAGEKYLKQWLLEETDTDENGVKRTNIDNIYSPGFLEELLEYNRKGNFDRISSFFMVLFQMQEEVLNKDYNTSSVNGNNELLNFIKSMYRK